MKQEKSEMGGNYDSREVEIESLNIFLRNLKEYESPIKAYVEDFLGVNPSLIESKRPSELKEKSREKSH